MPRLDRHFRNCSCTTRERHKSHLGSRGTGLAAKVGKMLNSSVTSSSLVLVGHGALNTDMSNRTISNSSGSTGSSRITTNSWHHHLVQRSVVLFAVGAFLALVLNLLQIQRNVTLFPEEVIATIFSSAWWVPPCCGTAEAVVGLLYLCIDSHLGEPHKFKREWASVMRCIAVFVGINHARAKLDFANNIQLSLTLAALSLGLWWTFDRSRSGLGLGITIAFLATLITQFLIYDGVYQYTSPDILYIRSWLPCIFFSGGVTVGNIDDNWLWRENCKPHWKIFTELRFLLARIIPPFSDDRNHWRSLNAFKYMASCDHRHENAHCIHFAFEHILAYVMFFLGLLLQQKGDSKY
ncbi:insulin-induced gene 1 protein-like [Tachyglossus aculeatus]|uniref:insulin-induced gene 1 protein-like n=1 Tax=Tachyglossus aculeatus TaxID=9261 RepID=UPI0018F43827|nr:insulin-induced gene 1 protein-like [Tachyglossus aculeatus]